MRWIGQNFDNHPTEGYEKVIWASVIKENKINKTMEDKLEKCWNWGNGTEGLHLVDIVGNWTVT